MAEKLWMSREFYEVVNRLVQKSLSEQQRAETTRTRPPVPDDWQDALILGKTDSAITKGNNGTISIYGKIGETTGSETDTGDNLTAHNRFADVGSGKWVYVLPSVGGNGYDLIAAEC